MGYGRWMMEDGRWDMGGGVGAATVSWIVQPGVRISYIQSPISDAFLEGTKKGAFRVFKCSSGIGLTRTFDRLSQTGRSRRILRRRELAIPGGWRKLELKCSESVHNCYRLNRRSKSSSKGLRLDWTAAQSISWSTMSYP